MVGVRDGQGATGQCMVGVRDGQCSAEVTALLEWSAVRWAEHVARMRIRCVCTGFGGNRKERDCLENIGVDGRMWLECMLGE